MDNILKKIAIDYNAFTIYLFDTSNFNLIDEFNNVIIFSALAEKTYKIHNEKLELYVGKFDVYMFDRFLKEDGIHLFNKHINMDAILSNTISIVQSILNINENNNYFGFGIECKNFIRQIIFN